jgi:acetoin utilization deacetylase AcuC-like enzyme
MEEIMGFAMKIVYDERIDNRYPTSPTDDPCRTGSAAIELRSKGFNFIKPYPASLTDILRVHGLQHIETVRSRGLFDAAALAAGGAICAAELALEGEPAFALIRPPGHHASAIRAWGMCYFNNMAIAVQKIRPNAKRVLIIDIDLHFGDGTVSIFRGDHEVKVFNPGCVDANFDYLTLNAGGYIKQIESALEDNSFDIIGVSAGFDTYMEDWGGLLGFDDYQKIGELIKEGSKCCADRRFALLEGGYHPDLRLCILSFLKGFSD